MATKKKENAVPEIIDNVEVETFKKPEPTEEEKEALAKKEAEKAARIKAAKEAKAAKAAAAKGSNA